MFSKVSAKLFHTANWVMTCENIVHQYFLLGLTLFVSAHSTLGHYVETAVKLQVCDTATHCNTLQHTATHCNTKSTLGHNGETAVKLKLCGTATHCNTLQHTATQIARWGIMSRQLSSCRCVLVEKKVIFNEQF